MNEERLAYLVSAYVDASLAGPERRELEDCLRQDAEIRTRFWLLAADYAWIDEAVRLKWGLESDRRELFPSLDGGANPADNSGPAARSANPDPASIMSYLRGIAGRLPGGEFTVGLLLFLCVATAFYGLSIYVFNPGAQHAPVAVAPVAPVPDAALPPGDRPATLFARLTPRADCIWAPDSPLAANPPGKAIELDAGQELRLISGAADISFASGTQVTMMGPANLQLASVAICNLKVGRLFAQVPRQAIGFTVVTPSVEVVDLGTEFGVEVREDGSTEVQVVVGEVALKREAESDVPETIVKAGEAVRVPGREEPAQNIAADPARFTRPIVSKTPAGDIATSSLDVVDLLGGGDGSGRSRGFAIDPTTGRRDDLPTRGAVRADATYHAMPLLQFADGCFVPNGRTQVDSAGHTFEFPATSGEVYDHIRVPRDIPGPNDPVARPPRFGQSNYEKAEHGLMYMVPNKGLTLDLAAIRHRNRDMSLRSFRAVVGISNAQPGDPHADVFVLVDGKSRFERRGLTKQDGGITAEVALEPGDGFLTLATTDGGDGWGGDWVIFVEPQLELGNAN